jgi:hypothetical protein
MNRQDQRFGLPSGSEGDDYVWTLVARLRTTPHRVSTLKSDPLFLAVETDGAIAELLNDQVRTLGEATRWVLIFLAGGLDHRPRPNWDEFIDCVSSIDGISEGHLRRLKFEAELYKMAVCCARWCDYGKHWYVTDDFRRKDCIDHRWSGQKARWRASPMNRSRGL